MSVAGAAVLLAVVWAVTFYCLLPFGIRSQSEDRQVVAGTPGSAPVEPRLWRKALWSTAISLAVWGALVVLIRGGVLSVGTGFPWGPAGG